MERRQGLRALIPTGTLGAPEPTGTLEEVAVGQLSPNPFQPRKAWNPEEMAELVESVKAHGILQPLVARKRAGKYELIAGERRLTAAREAGLATVPVAIREATDQEMLELALVENLQRQNLNPTEAAEAYQRLMKEFALTQDEVAQRVGKSRSTVANVLRLLSLSKPVLESLRNGEIETGHGKALLGIGNVGLQQRLWRRVVRRGLSVRQTEELVAKALIRNVPRGTYLSKPKATNDPNLQDLAIRLQDKLYAQVVLRPFRDGRPGGVIEIRYADDQDLEYIQKVILGRPVQSSGEALREGIGNRE